MLVALSVPARADEAPVVSDSVLAASVFDIDLRYAVTDVVPRVEDLQTESTTGSVTSVTVSSDVLFDFGKATLTPVARATVARLAGKLAPARGAITVTGYTDSIGTSQANAQLSLARARTVRLALLAAFPRPRPVTATGQGAANPVAPNVLAGRDNPSGRAMNRRVVITYR